VAILADKNTEGSMEDLPELQSLGSGLSYPSAICGERKLPNTSLYSILEDQTYEYFQLIHLLDVSDQWIRDVELVSQAM